MNEQADDSLASIFRLWPLILVSILVGAAGLGWAAHTRPATWSSSSKVVFGGDSSGLLSGATTGSGDVQRTLATQRDVVTSDAVLARAAKDLKIATRVLRTSTTAQTSADSNVLTISVTASSAREAARRTNAVASAYVDQQASLARSSLRGQAEALNTSITDLQQQIDQLPARGDGGALDNALTTLLQRQAQLSSAANAETGPAQVLATAQMPTSASSTSPLAGAVIGGGIGAVLGIGLSLVLLRYRPRRGTRRGTKASSRAGASESEPASAKT